MELKFGVRKGQKMPTKFLKMEQDKNLVCMSSLSQFGSGLFFTYLTK